MSWTLYLYIGWGKSKFTVVSTQKFMLVLLFVHYYFPYEQLSIYICPPCVFIPPFIVLHFIVLHICCVFHKLKARPSTSKKIMIHFIVTLTLLRLCGMKLTVSLGYACIYTFFFLFLPWFITAYFSHP